MGHNKLHHCMLGLTTTALALITIFCLQIPSMMKIVLWVIAIIGFLWAWVIGHAWMVIPALVEVPFTLLAYFFLSPVKVKQDRAFKDEYEILAYCLLPDRIIIVREFPTLNSIEGQSLFLTKKCLL